ARRVCLVAGAWGPLAAAGGLFPGRTDPQYEPGMKLTSDYLRRTGYRLPTEAEMEFFTRAGAATSRCFGETEDLLDKYAWYQRIRSNGHGRWGARSQTIWECLTCTGLCGAGVRKSTLLMRRTRV